MSFGFRSIRYNQYRFIVLCIFLHTQVYPSQAPLTSGLLVTRGLPDVPSHLWILPSVVHDYHGSARGTLKLHPVLNPLTTFIQSCYYRASLFLPPFICFLIFFFFFSLLALVFFFPSCFYSFLLAPDDSLPPYLLYLSISI